MKPIKFKEQNHCIQKPESMTDEQCNSLPCHIDYKNHQVISCWELTKEELEFINKTGKIYLSVMDIPPPPVALCVTPPFREIEIDKTPIAPIDEED